MALLFIDGFDHYNLADLGLKWTGQLVGGFIVVAMQTGRFGGQSYGIAPTSNGAVGIYKSIGTSVSDFVAGGAYFAQAAPPALCPLLSFFDGSSNEQVTIAIDTDGTLKFVHAGTALSQTNGSSYGPITFNTWNYIEVQISINSSVSANTCKLFVNGSLYQTLNAGQNTNSSSSGTVNSLHIYVGSNVFDTSNYRKWDDIYWAEIDSDITAPFGDCKVETLYPTGAGANTHWIPDSGSNYSRVNETYADGDTSYVSSDTPGDTDTYSFGNLATTATAIHAVQVTLWPRKDGTSSREVEAAINIGGTIYNGSPQSPMFSTYIVFCSIFRTNPATSVAWTNSDVNGAEYGMTVST